MALFQINRKLLWDYKFTDEELNGEPFKKWYIVRVLTHGGSSDIAAIGLKTIHDYLTQIHIPRPIFEFWLWYFSQPDIEAKYGHLDESTKSVLKGI